MSDSVTDLSTLFYLVEVAFFARTVYDFTRTYFTYKLRSSDPGLALEKPLPNPRPRIAPALPAPQPKKNAPVRVYMDGCFDGMHFGHANALRQAKALGDVLVVGINPEHEIRKHKGPPIMSDEERRIAVSSVKWVDEVLTDVPYVVTPEFLVKLIEEHKIDIIVHGDDPCIGADGQDVYKAVKEMGRFRTVKRTEGVSSTDIVGRMLLCTRSHHLDVHHSPTGIARLPEATVSDDEKALQSKKPFTRSSSFLPTTRRLIQFAGEPRAPKPGDRVVYCDGTFDMFHAGHIETLRQAKEMGDFLLVGIHDDATVNERKGSNFPIMNVHERTLAVLSCRYVDEVIIGAPWCVTEDMIKTMNITKVVHGHHQRDSKEVSTSDPYEVPRKLELLAQVQGERDLSVETILERIVRNREAFVTRNIKKEAAEDEYLTKHKKYVEER
ncbi:Ethanolamine-phosphate cytidylyltransferase [Gracilaria domingensis]|nr:Ethanolamine-phosphate cytidylyltransferase [Gracilaria domingensis]